MPESIKILIITSLILLSCSKSPLEQDGELLPDSPQYEASTTPVGFALGGDWKPVVKTKADPEPELEEVGNSPAKNAFVAGDVFGVFAYYIPNGESISTPNFMYNQGVMASDNTPSTPEDFSADIWSYTPEKYWPNTLGDKVSFYAYYPYLARSLTLPTTDASGAPVVTYDVTASHIDLLYAKAENKTKPAVAETVRFDFQHMLGQLRFKISVQNEAAGNQTIWVKSISYEDIPQAKFNFASETWTDKAAPRTYTAQRTDHGIEITEGTSYIYNYFTAFLVPTIIDEFTIGMSVNGQTIETITAAASPAIEIQKGKVTTVHLTITTQNINITSTTQDWITKNFEPVFTPDN